MLPGNCNYKKKPFGILAMPMIVYRTPSPPENSG